MREKQTDRLTDRQTDTGAHRQVDRGRQTNWQTDTRRHSARQTNGHID